MPNKLKPSLMHYDETRDYSIKNNKQVGATLIVVLVILILVTSIGIIAIKNSNTSLKISTAEQIGDIKFRANDASLIKLEKDDRVKNTRSADRDELKGYIADSVKDGEELTFCLRQSNKSIFKLNEITVKNKSGIPYANRNNGFCDPTNDDDYVNEGRVITQLTFVKETTSTAFGGAPAGTALAHATSLTCSRITGFITSLVPAVSDASQEDIGSCLKKGYDESKTETVDSCLTDINVTHETQMQVYKNIPIGFKCV